MTDVTVKPGVPPVSSTAHPSAASATAAPAKEKEAPKKKFYSRLNGTKFTMPSGFQLEFATMPDGTSLYETNDPKEIAELEAVMKISTALICLQPVVVKKSDAHILRDVGSSSAGTGAQNSDVIAALAASSNG